MTYDVHAHCVPEAVLAAFEDSDFDTGLEPGPRGPVPTIGGFRGIPIGDDLVSVDRRLDEMDRQGIRVQILSALIDLTGYELEPEDGLAWSRFYNDALSTAAQLQPERFEFMASVPLQDGSRAVVEMRRAVTELGAVGVEVGSRIGDRQLDHPDLEQFWAGAAELRCLVLLHPRDPLGGLDIDAYMMRHLVGRPAETTIAAARLMLSGVLERYPDLRIIVVHGGGFLPYQIGRLRQGYQRPRELSGIATTLDPCEAITHLYFDTILNEPRALRALVEIVGPDKVVMGTDYPYTLGDLDPVGSVNAIPEVDAKTRQLILRGNVERLLSEVRN